MSSSTVHVARADLAPAIVAAANSPLSQGRTGQLNPSVVLVGPKCLSDAIRAEPYPEKFKEPSKISNYDPSMEPEAWLSSYVMAMCIRNASENIQAKFMYLMMTDGAAKLWFNTLPEKSISSWSELKTAFIKNFQGTCKRLYTLEDLDRCVQKKGESARKWMSRVMEILHSSTDINPRSAL